MACGVGACLGMHGESSGRRPPKSRRAEGRIIFDLGEGRPGEIEGECGAETRKEGGMPVISEARRFGTPERVKKGRFSTPGRFSGSEERLRVDGSQKGRAGPHGRAGPIKIEKSGDASSGTFGYGEGHAGIIPLKRLGCLDYQGAFPGTPQGESTASLGGDRFGNAQCHRAGERGTGGVSPG